MSISIRRCLLAVVIGCAVADTVSAQDGNNAAYFLPNLPQRVRLNAAYQPEYKMWIGIPALSGISVNYNNSSFGVEDLLHKEGHDSLYVDIDGAYKKLRKNNIISVFNENSILSFGMRLKDSWYLTFDVTEKNDVVFTAKKNLFTFLKNGNAPYVGQNFDLGGVGLKASAYDEFAFGVSKRLGDKWTVGGRLKFLLGIGNVNMKKSKIHIDTKDDGSNLRLHSEQDLYITGPVTFDNTLDDEGYVDWDGIDTDFDDFSGKMIFNTKNPGAALDLGVEYKLNDKTKLYASIVDAGFIRWGGKGYRFSQNATFDWTGADASDSGNKNNPNYKSIDDAFEDMVDTLKNKFRLKQGQKSYMTMLHSALYLGATHDFHKYLTVGGLLRMTMMDKSIYPSLTVSAESRIHRNVSATVSYSAMLGNYANIGVGITAKAGPVQLYASTDNVLGTNYTKSKSVGGRFGINLLFGHKDKNKKVEEEEIPPVEVAPEAPIEVPEEVADTVEVPEPAPIVEAPKEATPEQKTEILVSPEKEETMLGAATVGTPFHVILGSFKSKQRAVTLQGKLVKMGFKDAMLMQNEQGMHRVSCISYPTREEAWVEVFEIREKYAQFSDAWVLKVN